MDKDIYKCMKRNFNIIYFKKMKIKSVILLYTHLVCKTLTCLIMPRVEEGMDLQECSHNAAGSKMCC